MMRGERLGTIGTSGGCLRLNVSDMVFAGRSKRR